MSIRTALKKLATPKIIEVAEVDGEKVYLREMSGDTRAQYVAACADKKEGEASAVTSAVVCAFGICDADGKLEYAYDKPDDIAELEALGGSFLQSTAMKLLELSGLLAKSDEEAEKK